MNTHLLGEIENKKFIGNVNLVVYFRNIYNIWYRGFSSIILDQIYNIITFGSICILCSFFFPWMFIPCLLFWIFQVLYISRHIIQLNQLRKLDIYYESWEETLFNLVNIQDEIQFCKIKPVLTQNDIKEYILFYDKYLSAMVQNKIIPFPNLIYSRIYHFVIVDYFLPRGRIKERNEQEIKKRFKIFSILYIVLFPVSILLIVWHLLRYFELFHGNIKQYRWSNYAIYYYRGKEEYYHETLERLRHLDEHAYNLVHFNDKPYVYTIIRLVSFISGNILFYCTSLIIAENDIILVRWIGTLGLIITFCQKWMNSRIDNIEKDLTVLISHLEDYNINKQKFSRMYINNMNHVIQEMVSFFQIIWYFLWEYPKYYEILKQFFENSSEFYFPIGDINN